MTQNQKQLLMTPTIRWVLLIDSVGTGIFAFILIFLTDLTKELIGVGNATIIQIVGIASIFLASFSFWTANQKKLSSTLVLLFATMCLILVIASITLLSLVSFTTTGVISITAIVTWVAIVGGFLYFFYYTAN